MRLYSLQKINDAQRSALRRHGPCVACGRENIQYGSSNGRLANTHLVYGDEWLDRYLEPLESGAYPFVFVEQYGRANEPAPFGSGVVGCEVLSTSGRGEVKTLNGLAYRMVVPYLCDSCKEEIQSGLNALVRAVQARHQADEQREQYESTWRKPRPGEFPVEQGQREFVLVAPDLSCREMKITWRTSKRYCIGSKPAFVMALTVDGVRHGGIIRSFEDVESKQNLAYDEPDEPIPAQEAAATELLADWVERRLQAQLKVVRADVNWKAQDPGAPCSCSSGGYRSPSVVRTTWIDGCTYSAIVDFLRIAELNELLARIGYTLAEGRRQLRSVLRERLTAPES